jgi:integrase
VVRRYFARLTREGKAPGTVRKVHTVLSAILSEAVPAELHGLRFHDLRHTAASMLIAQGAHPKIIQERLGHASITTTMNRYGHLFDGLDATLIDGLDAAHDDAANPPDNVMRLRPEDAAAEG